MEQPTTFYEANGFGGAYIYRAHTGFNTEQSAFFSTNESKIIDAMKQNGGSFARGIATAWERADSTNRGKLLAAFGELIFSYVIFVK